MGRCLQWLDGADEGWAKACPEAVPEVRPQGQKSPRWSAERRCRVPLFPGAFGKYAAAVTNCAVRRSASPHLGRGDRLKAQLARRRGNANAWLFEIRIRNAIPCPGRDAAFSRCGASLTCRFAEPGSHQTPESVTTPALQAPLRKCCALRCVRGTQHAGA